MPADAELAYLPATEALARFRTRELSPVELVEATLERAEASQESVNAFTVLYPDAARAAARRAEVRYAREPSEAGPLEGLPVAVKELTPVAGQQHTLASLALADNVATETAPIAERILAAGAIIHGRTTTPEFGCASYTHSRLYGVTRNPWNPRYGPAGSSGGGAAALALGATSLATGTDSAGSLRLPAAACGVVGFKPPFGCVPSPPPLGLETCHHDGPMARTIEDCRLLYEVISGPHPADPASRAPSIPPREPAGIAGMRIARVRGIAGVDLDPDVSANLDTGAAALAALGAEVEDVETGWDLDLVLEATRLHFAVTYGPMVARVAEAAPDLVTAYAADFAALEAGYAAEPGFALRANELVAALWAPLAEVFARYEAIVLPAMAIPAPVAGEEYLEEGPLVAGVPHPDRWTVAFTVPFNLCNWCPAMSVPCGFSRDGVPTGLQIVGRPYDEPAVFRIATAFERSHPWPGRPDLRPAPSINERGQKQCASA